MVESQTQEIAQIVKEKEIQQAEASGIEDAAQEARRQAEHFDALRKRAESEYVELQRKADALRVEVSMLQNIPRVIAASIRDS